MKLILEDKHLQIVKEILRKYPYSFYAFGSRVKNKARPLSSDLDICLLEAVPGKYYGSNRRGF